MKLPRWLLVSLLGLAGFSVLCFASWWWITWPSRTIHEFTELLQRGEFNEANRLLAPPGRWVIERVDGRAAVRFEGAELPHMAAEDWTEWCTLDNLDLEPRLLSDFLQSRQSFNFQGQFTTPFYIGGYATRGTVVLRCERWAVSTF